MISAVSTVIRRDILQKICHSSTLFCGTRIAGGNRAAGVPAIARQGLVEGQKAENILLDTGCARLKGNGKTDEAMVVMTRARVQKREEEANIRQREMESDVQLNNLQDSREKLQEVLENVTQEEDQLPDKEEESCPGSEFHDGLFSTGRFPLQALIQYQCLQRKSA